MQVIEIEPMNEEKNTNSSAREKCIFAERVGCWFIVLLTTLIISLFCAEVLELMHLRNSILKYELQKIIHGHNNYFQYKPIPWMP